MARSERRFCDAEERLWGSVGLSLPERRICLAEYVVEPRGAGGRQRCADIVDAWRSISGARWAQLVCGLDALLGDTGTRRNKLRSIPRVILLIRVMNERVLLTAEVLSRIEAWFLCGEDDPNGRAEVARPFISPMRSAELELRPGVGHASRIDELLNITDVIPRFLTR